MINITESEFYNNKVDRNGRAIHTTEGSMNLYAGVALVIIQHCIMVEQFMSTKVLST